MSPVLPTSGLAPPGAQTIVLSAVAPAVLPVMTNTGTTLYAVDFAQISAPGDLAVQVDLLAAPAGLVTDASATPDVATALISVVEALAAGTLTLSVQMTFRSGVLIRRDVVLPVSPLPALPGPSADALTLNGFAVSFFGTPIIVQASTLTVNGSQLTADSAPVTAGDP